MEVFTQLLTAAIASGTPLLFVTLGGILIERSGIIQLGAEGLMLMGAVTAAGTYLATGNLVLALLAVLLVTGALGMLHAFLTVTLRANQIVSGLALTLFGSGLSAYLGKAFTGIPVAGAIAKFDLGVLGTVDGFALASLGLVLVLQLAFFHTSWGLHLRAVGDNPATADVMGIRVQAVRYFCVVGGSMLMGLGGANLLLVFSPTWIEGMTTGRGWIAIALVIFARWNPLGALAACWFFGFLDTLGFRLQLAGSKIPTYFLNMLPYVLTIAVLIVVGWRTKHKMAKGPQALGVPYIREQRF
ncbi:MAG: ABC transporter permease [Spirochaetales bacterium]